jgi:hypothetical protein
VRTTYWLADGCFLLCPQIARKREEEREREEEGKQKASSLVLLL